MLTGLKNIALDSLAALGAKVLSTPLGLAINVTLAYIYGPNLMGTFFISFNLVLVLSAVCRLGFDNGLLRFAAILKSQNRLGAFPKLLMQALGLSIFLAVGIAITMNLQATWLADYFKAPALHYMLAYFSAAIPFYVALSLLQESLRGLGAVRWAAFGQDTVIPGTLLIFLLLLGYLFPEPFARPNVLGVAFLGSTVLGFVFLGIRILALLNNHNDAGNESFRNLFGFSWPLYGNALILLGLSTFDSLLLGLFSSSKEVAFYNTAGKIAVLVTFPLLAVNAVVPPVFGKFYHSQDLKSLENVAQITSRWMYLLALPIALLLILLAQPILSLFGPEFTAARRALTILVLGQIVNVAVGSVGYILIMTSHQKTLLWLQVLTTIIILPLMVLGAAYKGLEGVAGASALGTIGINLLMLWGVWHHLQIKTFAANGTWITCSGLVASGLFLMIKPMAGLIFASLIFIISYILLVLKILYHDIRQALFDFCELMPRRNIL